MHLSLKPSGAWDIASGNNSPPSTQLLYSRAHFHFSGTVYNSLILLSQEQIDSEIISL